jgi:hypothetical protein
MLLSFPVSLSDFIMTFRGMSYVALPSTFELIFTSCSVVESGMVRNLLPRKAVNLKQPILASSWSAAFSFSKCHAEKKV